MRISRENLFSGLNNLMVNTVLDEKYSEYFGFTELSVVREHHFGDRKAVYLSDAKRLQEALRKYMITSISFFDGAAEGSYHGMVLGLVASLSSKCYVRSNREAGEGRFDLQLEPKAKVFPGILMEFKAVPSSEKDKLAAQNMRTGAW